jgi:ABC-2 type transport system permease protein
MTALLTAELLKLRTTRTFAVLVGGAVTLALLIPGLVAAFAEGITEEDQRDLLRTDLLTGVFILSLAVVGMAGEWRHRTIAGALLAAPDRLRFFAAKVAAYALAGAVLALLVTIVTYLLMAVILSTRDVDVLPFGEVGESLWRNLVIAAYFGALGVGFGALIRNQAGAIVTALVLLFVVEPTLLAFWPDEARYLPFVGAPSGFVGEGDGEDLLDPGPAFLVMLGWVAVICGSAAELFRRRDIV